MEPIFFKRHAPDMQPLSFCFLNEDKSSHIVLMIVRFLWVPGAIIRRQRRFWWSWSRVEGKSCSAESCCTALLTELLRCWGNTFNLCRGRWGESLSLTSPLAKKE